MNEAQSELMDWLRDAHAMEKQAETMLSSTADRLDDYPELQAKLRQHYEETCEQARLVGQCLERLGEDTSTVKDVMGKTTAMAQAFSGVFASDEVVKAAMASYTFEHMEIAAYRTLIAAAELVGDHETKRVCEMILPQEEAMAKWLQERLATVTQQFLTREMGSESSIRR
ncbi:ferritin-like domain-containing protein [Candidimonas sp. SYP-B2681]|uniref:ferritin-like domain-containing protein n=1 Tax=Candidimonas sp. SYP-B2681 TaxID=2497686 RepID=UPI000F86CD53|nr:ferritin-like domain-containing protein [Candidimonas sp. SYP-B2681]RTZ45580.1 ferritin-like domain-containing protein [Candidimonas sp. SYP-B2681]